MFLLFLFLLGKDLVYLPFLEAKEKVLFLNLAVEIPVFYIGQNF
ncbi:hypothetical protein SAMN05720469_10934 [Fibrobacter intestinalis]|uniref:Uncharacterized protein n=1 Tax=Fibrobacter intestinalis TaxID=28122 RepID=A0A1M6T9D8_9BACT|nr:hypothetical protein BGX14_1661 [Fibrobacter sp. UWS1]PBC74457.1 hypothetical protein BGW94_2109 [Fibrobacter sp. NR9]SHK53583.1 hypothetical protein SAMN05720469_10934 [Fibrobacter intestinalis]SJZ81683.1 hypothetical protein SAMN02745108_01679 [Fibrobacter intestinalis]